MFFHTSKKKQTNKPFLACAKKIIAPTVNQMSIINNWVQFYWLPPARLLPVLLNLNITFIEPVNHKFCCLPENPEKNVCDLKLKHSWITEQDKTKHRSHL